MATICYFESELYKQLLICPFLLTQTPPKSSISVSRQDSSKGSHRTGGQLRSPVKSHQISHNWSDESLSMTQSGKCNICLDLICCFKASHFNK